ncbi:NAD-binding protein [Terrisporobacter sp.]
MDGIEVVPVLKPKKVLVEGGGLAECEVAIHLAHDGKKVRLVEMRNKLVPDANIRYRPILLNEIEKQGVEVHTEFKGLKVTS